MPDHIPKVVIIGGGFAGLGAARKLTARRWSRRAFDVTLIDRQNHHLFQPLLYQVATGALSPANIAAPLRNLFRNKQNITVIQDDVQEIDVAGKQVVGQKGSWDWDYLLLAAGGQTNYFGKDDWIDAAPGLKTIDDATAIRGKVLRAFEAAELTEDPQLRKQLLTFVIVGGGPTGVEMTGAIAEMTRFTLRGEFRHFDPASARVILVDASDRILSGFPDKLSDKAWDKLASLNVERRMNSRVVEVDDQSVTIQCGDQTDRVETRNVIWGAGVRPSSLARKVADQTGAETDRGGRIRVNANLSLGDHPHVFAAGDLTSLDDKDGNPLPGLAPVALQQGIHAATTMMRLESGWPTVPFRYRDYGSMAVIGRGAAIADTPFGNFSGWFGWLFWLLVHLMNITRFENRVLVLIQWGWNYITRGRSARLITKDRS